MAVCVQLAASCVQNILLVISLLIFAASRAQTATHSIENMVNARVLPGFRIANVIIDIQIDYELHNNNTESHDEHSVKLRNASTADNRRVVRDAACSAGDVELLGAGGACSDSYYQCAAGEMVQYRCGYGMVYDVHAHTCVNRHALRCGDRKNNEFSELRGSDKLDIDSELPPCRSDGYFRSPTDCSQFYRCEGTFRHFFSCPQGLAFDEVALLCDANIDCTNQNLSPLHKQSSAESRGIQTEMGGDDAAAAELHDAGGTAARDTHASSAGSHSALMYNEGTPTIPVTSAALPHAPVMSPTAASAHVPAPDDATEWVDAPEDTAATERVDKHERKPIGTDTNDIRLDYAAVTCSEDGYYRHPTDCRRFYQCASGSAFVKTCSLQLVFNDRTDICDWPENVPECRRFSGAENNFLHKDGNLVITNIVQSSTEHQEALNEQTSILPEDSKQNGVVADNNLAHRCVPGASRADDNDCRVFYVCRADGTEHQYKCPKELYYNIHKGRCDANDVPITCATKAEPENPGNHTKEVRHDSATGASDTGVYADLDLGVHHGDVTMENIETMCNDNTRFFQLSTACETFYECIDSRPVMLHCPTRAHFNMTSLMCQYSPEVCSTDSTTRIVHKAKATKRTKRSAADERRAGSQTFPTLATVQPIDCEADHIYPDTSNCSVFYTCFNNTLTKYSCQYGNAFRRDILSCAWAGPGSKVCAKNSTEDLLALNDPRVDTETTEYFNRDASDGTGCMNGARFPHEDDCSYFYQCFNNELILLKCATSSLYNPTTQRCDTRGTCVQRDQQQEVQPDVVPELVSNRVSTSRVSPNRVSTSIVSPNRVSTNRVYPNRVSPSRVLPNRRDVVGDKPGHSMISSSNMLRSDSSIAAQYYSQPLTENSSSDDNVCPQDGLWPHPYSCRRYTDCRNGHGIDMQCPPAQKFDANSGICVDEQTPNLVCFGENGASVEVTPLRPLLQGDLLRISPQPAASRGQLASTVALRPDSRHGGTDGAPQVADVPQAYRGPTVFFDDGLTAAQACRSGSVLSDGACSASYRYCTRGRYMQRYCTAGLVYDARHGTCDTPDVVTACRQTDTRLDIEPDVQTDVRSDHLLPLHSQVRPSSVNFGRTDRQKTSQPNTDRHSNGQSVSYSVTDQCTGNGYFRDPTDCRKFYYCRDGWIRYRMICAVGLVYDHTTHRCLWPQLVSECAHIVVNK